MRQTMAYCVLAFAVTGIVGCGTRIDEQELGKIINEVPEIPSRYDVYELPDMPVPPAADSASDHQGHVH